jgi:hypothetical protein
MDESRCQDFFLRPNQTFHRRYEALRAFFLDRQPLAEVAQAYGYRYGTLRNLVAEFRARCHEGQVPPFSPNPGGDGRAATAPLCRLLGPSPLSWPTVANSA